MSTVESVSQFLGEVAPLALAESWDNVGLLLGDRRSSVKRVMTCLTLSPSTVGEAIQQQADLVVAHHPLPFKPVGTITTDSYTGGLLWQLASHQVAVYCPHTAWDSAARGVNAQLAKMLSLREVAPMQPSEVPGLEHCGAGRYGLTATEFSLDEFAGRVEQLVPNSRMRFVDAGRMVQRVGIACGSGGSLLSLAVRSGCDTLLTGEATFHSCLEAEAAGVNLVMNGHYASERFSLDQLATQLSEQFPSLDVWASKNETDPVRNL
ncbi:MAG: Nif3-like dinuclear metal center hexameric protein [Aureliella sp.]